MWHFGNWIHFSLTFVGMVHSTWPSRVKWHMHAPTFNKWQKKKKNEKVTLHILTHGAMQGCALTSLVVWISDKICDIRERNLTIKSEIWTTNIRSLGFRDVREWVILQSFKCSYRVFSKIHCNLWCIAHTHRWAYGSHQYGCYFVANKWVKVY